MARYSPVLKTIIVGLLLAFVLSSCRTYKMINPQTEELKVGDSVHIVTKNGQHAYFELQAVIQDTLYGDNVQVSLGEVAKIEKKKIDAASTILAAVLAAPVAFLLYALLLLGSSDI